MSVEQSLQIRWAASAALTAAVPAARVFTGTAWGLDVDSDLPYATIRRVGKSPRYRTNGGNETHDVYLEIETVAATLDTVLAVETAARTTFNRVSWSDAGSVARYCEVQDHATEMGDDGAWTGRLTIRVEQVLTQTA